MNFPDISREDSEAIDRIVQRASVHFTSVSRTALTMDLMVAHGCCPLDLKGLLDAGTADFNHDIAGIIQHVDRREYKLEGCFLPRYARANHPLSGKSTEEMPVEWIHKLAVIATGRSASADDERFLTGAGLINPANDGWIDLSEEGRALLMSKGYAYDPVDGWSAETADLSDTQNPGM